MPAYPGAFYPSDPSAYPSYTGDIVVPPPPPLAVPTVPAEIGGPPTSDWLIGLGPRTGGIVREITETVAPKLTFKLGSNSDTTIEIDGRSEAAKWITELETDLHVQWRPDPATPRRQLYRGRIGKVSDKLDRDTHRLTVPSVDYRGLLARRMLFTGSTVTYTNVDQGLIGWNLINGVQNPTGGGGGMGITQNPAGVTTGVLKSRTFTLQDEVAAKLQEFAETDNGFEWDILAPDPFNLYYTVFYPRRGADRQVILEYGGNAPEVNRDVDSSGYGNAIRVKGVAPEGGSEPPPYEAYAADIATRPEGRWDLVVTTQLTTGAAINERMAWQLAQAQVIPISYTFKMRPGWWRGPDHVWLGDSVRAIVYSGRLEVDAILRVQQIEITPLRGGGEEVMISVGSPPPDPRRRASDIERRLDALERR